jgi:hypothetical protein
MYPNSRMFLEDSYSQVVKVVMEPIPRRKGSLRVQNACYLGELRGAVQGYYEHCDIPDLEGLSDEFPTQHGR